MKNTLANEYEQFERKAMKVKLAIDELAESLYNINARDPKLRYENLKTYRVEIMRGFIVYTHLAIEDLLRAILFDFLVKQNRLLTNKETIRIVDELRSAELIQWCGRLNLVTAKRYRHLLELNRIRNACAHNWIVDIPRYKRMGPKGAKRRVKIPIVMYNNRNLFGPKIFSDEFCTTYGDIYLKLLWKVWRLQGKL